MNKTRFFPVVLLSILLIVSGVMANDHDAVYNAVNTVCTINGNNANVVEQTKITVNQKSGSEYVPLYFMETGFVKLKKIKITVYDSGGNLVNTLKKGDLAKACGFGTSYQLYNDICYYYKEIAYPQYPYVVNIYVERDIESLFFWRGIQFQRDIPVESFSYRLICPKDFEFSYKTYGLDIEPVIDSADDKNYYSWALDSIAVLPDIKDAPDEYLDRGRLMFVADEFQLGKYDFEGSTWQDVGAFYSELARECYVNSDVKEPLTSSLKEGLRDVYDDIVRSTRYVSVSIDIGGWQPHETKFITERGYGDCKDLSTLLISRLSGFDIETYPCLALTRGNGQTDTSFPNYLFNHVFVLAVNGDDSLWMDPTCSKCPIGEIPYGDEDINVLVVKDDGGVIRKTKRSLPEDNMTSKISRVTITENGSMELNFVNTYTGHIARSYRNNIEESTEEEFRNYFTNVLPGGDRNFEITDITIKNAADVYKPLIIECRAKRKKPIDFFRNTYYIPVDIFENLIPFSNLDLGDREVGVRINYPARYEYDLEFCWDSTLSIDSIAIPTDTEIKIPSGTVSCYYTLSGDTVRAKLLRISNIYLIEPYDFESQNKFRDDCRDIAGEHIKLYRSN